MSPQRVKRKRAIREVRVVLRWLGGVGDVLDGEVVGGDSRHVKATLGSRKRVPDSLMFDSASASLDMIIFKLDSFLHAFEC